MKEVLLLFGASIFPYFYVFTDLNPFTQFMLPELQKFNKLYLFDNYLDKQFQEGFGSKCTE